MADENVSSTDWDHEEPEEPFRFSCAVMVENQAPILSIPSLAQLVANIVTEVFKGQNTQLWGYVVMPDAVYTVIEVKRESDYHVLVETFKTQSETSLIATILDHHPEWVDMIIRFNPVWSEALYRIWQDGYHTQQLNSPYAVSNRVADLLYKPVEAGLVDTIADWPYSSYHPLDIP